MRVIVRTRRPLISYDLLICAILSCAMILPAFPVLAAASFQTQLETFLARDPAHFNEHMWTLIRANPDAKDEIFATAVKLSLQKEIALAPERKAEILAKFKHLYPQLAGQFDTQEGPTTVHLARQEADLRNVQSQSYGTLRTIALADDPDVPAKTWWGRNWPWVVLGSGAAIGGGIAAVSLMSSSSSSDSAVFDPFATPPITGASPEYTLQSGLGRINAGTANDAGFTGQGIIAAVIDSGVNVLHPDLKDNIAPGGYDFINDTGEITDTDASNHHGTHVAGIIAAGKNDFGMRGVAYDAKILPLAAIGSDDVAAPQTAVTDAVNLAVSRGADVLNASYGPNDVMNQLFIDNGAQLVWDNALTQADAYLNAANQGMILVFAAGNSYDATLPPSDAVNLMNANPTGGGFLPFIRPVNENLALGTNGAYRKYDLDTGQLTILLHDYSGLESHLLTVVALNPDNSIAGFSNRCGVAKDWCVSAPGVDIVSTVNRNEYMPLSGTSMAAPHVSGAIAVLLDQHPELTPAQVVNLLKVTATDLGAAGVDDVYGNGLINLAAATASMGPFSLSLGSSMNGPSAMLSGSTMHFSPAFGGSVSKALAATEVGVLDAYTRNFTVTLDRQISAQAAGFDNMTALRRFGQKEFRPEIDLDRKNTVSFTMRTKSDTKKEAGNNRETTFDSYSLTHQASETVAVNVSHGDPRATALYYQEDDRQLLSSQVAASGVGNAYLDFVADGYADHVTVDAPWDGKLRILTAMGAPGNDGEQRNMLASGEVSFGGDETGISLTGGSLIEEDRALGLRGDGAFALGEGTTTWFGGVSAHLQVAEDMQIDASLFGGITRAAANDASLIQEIDGIRSTSWRVGISRSNLWNSDDRVRLNVAQPLRAESGALHVNLPQYRLRDGAIISQNIGYNLAPSGRELDFEAGYQMPIGAATKVDFAAMYRRDAGHVAGSDDAVGLARLNHSF